MTINKKILKGNKMNTEALINYYEKLVQTASDEHIKKSAIISKIITKEIIFVNDKDLEEFINNNLNGCPESFGLLKFNRLCRTNNGSCAECWKRILK